MLALKMLLMVAGALLLAAAVAIPLYGLWLRMQAARKKPVETERRTRTSAEPKEIQLAPLGRARDRRLPAAAGGGQHCGGAQRHGRRAHQPDSAARCRARSIPACTLLRRWWTACRSSTCAITCSPQESAEQGAKKAPRNAPA